MLQSRKGSTLKVHYYTSLEARISSLEHVTGAATERKKRKKKRIQQGETLSKDEGGDSVAQKHGKSSEERKV